MNVVDLITRKKNNNVITEEMWNFFVKEVLNGTIKDYQISAFFMAICFNDLNFDETYYLVKAMVENGITLKYENIKGPIVDKHSTGGIGDKVSLILVPILASMGIKVSKISGKGLGYTGGTIDKLDSVNIHTNISKEKLLDVLQKDCMVFIQQTDDIVPSDKIFYSIRDTSSTIDNIPLIVASIMSKKIATNADLIYLDVKVGDGSFFKTFKECRKFGQFCIEIGKRFNKKVCIHYTNMEGPLGRCLGNLIEVKEAIDFLKGNCYSDSLKELIYGFASDIINDCNKYNNHPIKNKTQIYNQIDDVLKQNKAFALFKKWAKDQDSDFNFDDINSLYNPKYVKVIYSETSGYLNFLSNKKFGYALIQLKAGRMNKMDEIDYYSGIYLNKTIGEKVEKNEPILTLYSNNEIFDSVVEELKNNIVTSDEPIKQTKSIIGIETQDYFEIDKNYL